MKNTNSSKVKLIIGSLLLSTLSAIQATPSQAATTYNLDLTKTYTNGPGAIARGDGFLFFSTGNTFRQVKESNGFLNTNILNINAGESTSPIVKMAFLNSTIFVLRENGSVDKGTPDSPGTGQVGLQFTFGSVCTGSTSEKNNDIVNDANYILVICKSDKTIHLFDDMGELGSASTTWTPGRATLADGYAYVTNLDSTDIKRFSLVSLNAAPYSISTSPLAFPITSINAGTDIALNPNELQLTSDSQYVWVSSGVNTNVIKISRIKKSDNSVTTINLTGYNVNTNSSNYQVGGISSDGTTLFISLYQQPTILALNIADSTFTSIATPTMSVRAIQSVTGGFWVSGATAALKYLAVAAASTDTSAEARRKRQAEIDAARNSLVQKIKAGDTVVNPDFIAADVQQFNTEIAKKVNADFQIAAKAKDFGFPSVRTIVTKWGIYQDIENGVRSTVTGRTASAAGLIPVDVVQKQLLISRVQNVAPAQRATVEQIDKLIANFAAIDAARKAKLAEVLKRRSK